MATHSGEQKSQTKTLRLKQFCDEYGLSIGGAYNELRAGRLRARKFGRATLIERAEAERWLASLPEFQAAAA